MYSLLQAHFLFLFFFFWGMSSALFVNEWLFWVDSVQAKFLPNSNVLFQPCPVGWASLSDLCSCQAARSVRCLRDHKFLGSCAKGSCQTFAAIYWFCSALPSLLTNLLSSWAGLSSYYLSLHVLHEPSLDCSSPIPKSYVLSAVLSINLLTLILCSSPLL